MTPTTDRPFFRLPSRGTLAVLAEAFHPEVHVTFSWQGTCPPWIGGILFVLRQA